MFESVEIKTTRVVSYMFDKRFERDHVQIVHVFIGIKGKLSRELVGNGLVVPIWDPGISLKIPKLVRHTNYVREILMDVSSIFCLHRSSNNINRVWDTEWQWLKHLPVVHIHPICSVAAISTYSHIYNGIGGLYLHVTTSSSEEIVIPWDTILQLTFRSLFTRAKGSLEELHITRRELSVNWTESGTFKDRDLRVNGNGVRIVSKNRVAALSVIQPSDNPLSLADFEEVKVIGKGNSGIVRRVQHKWTKQFFALKVIHMNIEESIRKHIARELRINPSLQCSYVVICYQSFFDYGAISIILEYMDGGSLADFLKKVKTIPEQFLTAFNKQVFKGLWYLHHEKHIIHKDLKPLNLLINHRGDVKFTDFSVSALLASTSGQDNTFVGTYNYITPVRNSGGAHGYKGYISNLSLVPLECATVRIMVYDLRFIFYPGGILIGLVYGSLIATTPETRGLSHQLQFDPGRSYLEKYGYLSDSSAALIILHKMIMKLSWKINSYQQKMVVSDATIVNEWSKAFKWDNSYQFSLPQNITKGDQLLLALLGEHFLVLPFDPGGSGSAFTILEVKDVLKQQGM